MAVSLPLFLVELMLSFLSMVFGNSSSTKQQGSLLLCPAPVLAGNFLQKQSFSNCCFVLKVGWHIAAAVICVCFAGLGLVERRKGKRTI